MGLSRAQESEMKNLSKEVVKEFLTDKEFMDSFCEKIVAVVTKKVSVDFDNFKKQINTCETQIAKIQGEYSLLKEEHDDLKNRLNEVLALYSPGTVQSNNKVVTKLDDLEQSARLQQLRIFGVPEEKNENLRKLVTDIFYRNMGIGNCQFETCYRIGSHSNGNKNPRPIIVKFINMVDRNNIFYNKKKLKGKKIAIAEELTRSRYQLLQLTKEKFDKDNVWTKEGKICVKLEGKKHTIKTVEDLEKLMK